jgi:MscS family membrane protein
VGFGAYSLDVEIHAYASTGDFKEFLAIREDVYLRMMDVVEKSGTGFAFPSQTSYLCRDTGLNEEATRASEAEVEAWREKGRLPFPSLPEERITDLEGTLDYPPRGSFQAAEDSLQAES